jgi:hypothetical protein
MNILKTSVTRAKMRLACDSNTRKYSNLKKGALNNSLSPDRSGQFQVVLGVAGYGMQANPDSDEIVARDMSLNSIKIEKKTSGACYST